MLEFWKIVASPLTLTWRDRRALGRITVIIYAVFKSAGRACCKALGTAGIFYVRNDAGEIKGEAKVD